MAASADGEGYCRDFRPLDCVEYLLFSGEEKRSKKVVGTLATVSQTPQRFLVIARLCRIAPLNVFWASELINTRFLTVGTDVLGCPIVGSGKSMRFILNRIISFMSHF